MRELGRDLQLVSRRLAAAAIDGKFVTDLLAFREAKQPCALNRADVNEHIRSAGLRLDEAEAFLGVEPFYDTGLHDMSFQEQVPRRTNGAALGIEVLERKSGADAKGAEARSFGRNSMSNT
jgi:hypothetical protein